MSGPGPAQPGAGLCATCGHRRLVGNRKGSRFSLCRLSETDRRYPRYPRLPVLLCRGYEGQGEDPWEKLRETEGDVPGKPDGARGEGP